MALFLQNAFKAVLLGSNVAVNLNKQHKEYNKRNTCMTVSRVDQESAHLNQIDLQEYEAAVKCKEIQAFSWGQTFGYLYTCLGAGG